MNKENKLIRMYTGSEITANLLKEEFENSGISGLIQNDFNSGLAAGFSGGVPSAIDLLIQELDLKKAEPIINEFMKFNKE